MSNKRGLERQLILKVQSNTIRDKQTRMGLIGEIDKIAKLRTLQ